MDNYDYIIPLVSAITVTTLAFKHAKYIKCPFYNRKICKYYFGHCNCDLK